MVERLQTLISRIKDNCLCVIGIIAIVFCLFLILALWQYGEVTINTSNSKSNIKWLKRTFENQKDQYRNLQDTFNVYLEVARASNKQSEAIRYIIIKDQKETDAELSAINSLSADSQVQLFTRQSEEYLSSSTSEVH